MSGFDPNSFSAHNVPAHRTRKRIGTPALGAKVHVVSDTNTGTIEMTSNRSVLAVTIKGLLRAIGICIPLTILLSLAQAQNSKPSQGAKGMPGALGTMEFKPSDWKGNIKTYWTDTDGVNPTQVLA
jgi:hypothetical protein